jgi:osmotically-inducible protein OsmY
MTSKLTSINRLSALNKRLGVLVVGTAMLALAGCASTATHQSTGEYVSDAVVTTRVKAAIVKDPVLKATEINVETYKGTVQLSGFVKDKQAIAKASDVARSVDGVTSVKNDIRIK